MERAESSTTMRARKVTYDEYTGIFYVESRLEALERQVLCHAKMAEVLNRSQESKLRFITKQDKGARDIACRKLDKEGRHQRQALRDRIAYSQILREFSSGKSEGGDELSPRAVYDLELSRQDIQTLIQKKLKDSTPSAKRKRQSKNILNSRRLIQVFDRTQSTSALLRMKDKIASRPTSEQLQATPLDAADTRAPYQRRSGPPKLILPPITVRRQHHRTSGELTRGQKPVGHEQNRSLFMTDCDSSDSVRLTQTPDVKNEK
ncbi:unnamed protein product [Lymnaea stagnalis]|uniref:Uncharacterized protein n=1 Tax=Lymnaea stagnalis TaxID=6523 RepID=A0AAV2I2Y2_LYMST